MLAYNRSIDRSIGDGVTILSASPHSQSVTSGASPKEAIPTPDRIRAAAIELFAEQGFAATGIREIAGRAGISSSVLYHHVANKEQLLVEIMLDGLSNLLASAHRAVAVPADPATKVARLVVTHMQIEVGYVASSTVIDSEFGALNLNERPRVLELRDSYQEIWRQVLGAGAADGTLDARDIRLSVLLLIDLCNGIGRWFRPNGRLGLEEVLSYAVDCVLGALRATADGSPIRASDLDLDVAALIAELEATPRVAYDPDAEPITPT